MFRDRRKAVKAAEINKSRSSHAPLLKPSQPSHTTNNTRVSRTGLDVTMAKINDTPNVDAKAKAKKVTAKVEAAIPAKKRKAAPEAALDLDVESRAKQMAVKKRRTEPEREETVNSKSSTNKKAHQIQMASEDRKAGAVDKSPKIARSEHSTGPVQTANDAQSSTNQKVTVDSKGSKKKVRPNKRAADDRQAQDMEEKTKATGSTN